jgi:DNA-binding response OmpR family regulator
MNSSVLIVDQELVASDLLRQLLQSNGFHVSTRRMGDLSPSQDSSPEPGLMILNLMRPDTEAAALCRQVREQGNVPVLALSPINDPNAIAGLLDAGADDHLVKPVPGGVLIAHVRRLLRSNGAIRRREPPLPTLVGADAPL